MNRKFLFLPIYVLLILFSFNFAKADVLIEDVEENSMQSAVAAFGQGTIETGSGQQGNYVIFSCGVPNDIGNIINDPAPGIWDDLDEGACGGTGQRCAHGIWGGFVSDPDSEEITCSWTEFGTVFSAGSMRFTGVDPSDPIIGVDCDTGQGVEATAPSINTEAGSQVLSVFTLGLLTTGTSPIADPTLANRAEPEGDWFANANSGVQNVLSIGISELEEIAGPTGTVSVSLGDVPFEWRACTIALRMASPRSVPTMSEWGLISFAAFAGIAGFFFLRRRQATA